MHKIPVKYHDYAPQYSKPSDCDEIKIVATNPDGRARAAGLLFREAFKLPGADDYQPYGLANTSVNHELQNAIAWIAEELCQLGSLEFTPSVEASPDDEFHLLVSTDLLNPLNYLVVLQVPALGTGTPAPFDTFVHKVPEGGESEIIFDFTDPFIFYEVNISGASDGNGFLVQFNDDDVANEYHSNFQASFFAGSAVDTEDDTYEHLTGDVPGIQFDLAMFSSSGEGEHRFANITLRIFNAPIDLAWRTVDMDGWQCYDATNPGNLVKLHGGGQWHNAQGIIRIKLLALLGGIFSEGTTVMVRAYREPT